VKRVNTKVFERLAEKPDAYRITEFAEMHFDEASSWCGRSMNEGDKKQSWVECGGESRKYVQANTYNYAARAAAVVTNAERTSRAAFRNITRPR